MPREKVDYRAARAVLSAPYPLPVIITRSRAAASAPPPSSIPLTEVPVEDDHHSIIEIIPDPPPTPTTGGLAAQHGFPYNSKWKSIPPAFPPIPYPPKAEGSGGKNILKLKKKHQGDKDEAEAMSGIEEGTSGEKDTLHEISGMGEVAMPAVPASFPGLLSSAFEINLVSGFVSQTPSPPEGIVNKGKAPIRTAPPEALAMAVHQAAAATPVMAPPLVTLNGAATTLKPTPITGSTIPAQAAPAALDRAWSPTSVSSNIRSWSAGLEADEEDASNLSESPDTQRLITPAESKELRRVPKFFGETNLAPFTYDPEGFESEATSQRTITRIPRSKYKRAAPLASTSTLALPTRPADTRTPPRQFKRQRKGSTTPTPQESSRQAFLGDRSPTPTQANQVRSGFPSIHPHVPSRGTVSDLTAQRFYDVPPSLPSPMPMSIDPRSADMLRQDPSWPSSGDYTPNIFPPARAQYPNTYPPEQIPHYVTPYRPARHQSLQDLRVPGVPSHRPGHLPAAKASHRLLLQRKVEDAKRRRLIEEHNRRTFERAQRDGKMLVSSSPRRDRREPKDFTRLYTALGIEDIHDMGIEELAHMGGGRKRRRAEVSESTWGEGSRHNPNLGLLPSAPIYVDDDDDDDMFDEPIFDMDLEESVVHRTTSPPRFQRITSPPRVHFGSSSAHQLPPHLSTPRPSIPGMPRRSSHSPRGDLRQMTIHERMEDVDEDGEPNELSAFNLMVAQAASQRTLKQHEKDARRAEWIRENRERLATARGPRRVNDGGPSGTRDRDVSMGRGLSVARTRDVSMGVEHAGHTGASRRKSVERRGR